MRVPISLALLLSACALRASAVLRAAADVADLDASLDAGGASVVLPPAINLVIVRHAFSCANLEKNFKDFVNPNLNPAKVKYVLDPMLRCVARRGDEGEGGGSARPRSSSDASSPLAPLPPLFSLARSMLGVRTSDWAKDGLRAYLHNELGGRPFAVWSSVMMRAQETAYYMLAGPAGLPINVVPHVGEDRPSFCPLGMCNENTPSVRTAQLEKLSARNPGVVERLSRGRDFRDTAADTKPQGKSSALVNAADYVAYDSGISDIKKFLTWIARPGAAKRWAGADNCFFVEGGEEECNVVLFTCVAAAACATAACACPPPPCGAPRTPPRAPRRHPHAHSPRLLQAQQLHEGELRRRQERNLQQRRLRVASGALRREVGPHLQDRGGRLLLQEGCVRGCCDDTGRGREWRDARGAQTPRAPRPAGADACPPPFPPCARAHARPPRRRPLPRRAAGSDKLKKLNKQADKHIARVVKKNEAQTKFEAAQAKLQEAHVQAAGAVLGDQTTAKKGLKEAPAMNAAVDKATEERNKAAAKLDKATAEAEAAKPVVYMLQRFGLPNLKLDALAQRAAAGRIYYNGASGCPRVTACKGRTPPDLSCGAAEPVVLNTPACRYTDAVQMRANPMLVQVFIAKVETSVENSYLNDGALCAPYKPLELEEENALVRQPRGADDGDAVRHRGLMRQRLADYKRTEEELAQKKTELKVQDKADAAQAKTQAKAQAKAAGKK